MAKMPKPKDDEVPLMFWTKYYAARFAVNLTKRRRRRRARNTR